MLHSGCRGRKELSSVRKKHLQNALTDDETIKACGLYEIFINIIGEARQFGCHGRITDNSYAVLKRVASAFLCLYLAKDSSQPVNQILTEAVEMILPRKHSLEPIVRYFRRIGNTVDSRVRVPSDLAVYRELDRLVDYGLLVADSKANNVVFRRCSLNVHSKTLGEILRGVTLPMAIGYWFDTQTA
ncbi:hypothetical protein OSTOST_07050 [Ostertagia ostertagi]